MRTWHFSNSVRTIDLEPETTRAPLCHLLRARLQHSRKSIYIVVNVMSLLQTYQLYIEA
jgi:hypothetical protein